MPSAAVPLALTLSLTLAQSPPAGPRARYDQALSLQKQGKYDEAIRAFEEALREKPSGALEADIHLELAETYFRKGQDASEGKLAGVDPEPLLRTAAKLFGATARRFAALEEQAGQATYMTGSSYLMLGDLESALEAYESAYRDFPGSSRRPAALIRTGVCKAGVGDAAGALAAYRRFLSQYPGEGAAKKVRSYLYQSGIVGKPAPPIHASEWLNGMAPEGLDTVRGEIVVVLFLASWCHNCKDVLPHLKREVSYWRDEGVIFLGVMNPQDPKNTMAPAAYVRQHELELFDVGLDPGGRTWGPYRVSGLPAAAVVDRRGTVRWRGHFSFLGRTLLEKLLRE